MFTAEREHFFFSNEDTEKAFVLESWFKEKGYFRAVYKLITTINFYSPWITIPGDIVFQLAPLTVSNVENFNLGIQGSFKLVIYFAVV